MTYPPYSPPNGFEHQPRPLLAAAEESRERAIRLLTDAYAYDEITELEFERRLGMLSLAASPAMMSSAVAGLGQRGALVRDPVPGYLPVPREGRIVGFMSETRRKGPWRVPQRLLVRATMSDVKIDLRYAAIPPGCAIEVRALMSSVSIIVPPGLSVGFHIDPFLGAAGSDADDSMVPGLSHVSITGSCFMAEVRVRVRALGR
ncbi:MAG: hypothetical protein JWL61_890 [Gemmatimonadetes bacterium]|nr:hypothetical protein [Gemmatimonadota bacterium]